MDLDLQGKTFYIAGSSRGIGLGIAECFLKEGACVAITGRDSDSLDRAFKNLSGIYGERVLSLKGDVGKKDIFSHHMDTVINQFGALHGVVANIGNGREPSKFPQDDNLWDNSYHVNFQTSLCLAKNSFDYLKMNSGSTFTFISSIAGLEDLGAPIPYSVYKSTLHSFAKMLSREFSPIRVNTIAPGNILFEGGSWDKKIQEDPGKIQSYIEKEVPLKTFGDPEDVGNICCFLASQKAKFITGSVIVTDGGQTRKF